MKIATNTHVGIDWIGGVTDPWKDYQWGGVSVVDGESWVLLRPVGPDGVARQGKWFYARLSSIDTIELK